MNIHYVTSCSLFVFFFTCWDICDTHYQGSPILCRKHHSLQTVVSRFVTSPNKTFFVHWEPAHTDSVIFINLRSQIWIGFWHSNYLLCVCLRMQYCYWSLDECSEKMTFKTPLKEIQARNYYGLVWSCAGLKLRWSPQTNFSFH